MAGHGIHYDSNIQVTLYVAMILDVRVVTGYIVEQI